MKKLLAVLVFLFSVGVAYGQQGNTQSISFPGAPTGTCAFPMQAFNSANGDHYDCNNGVWRLMVSGGGGGTVTNVSGTANQIDVVNGATTPVLSIDSSLILPGTLAIPSLIPGGLLSSDGLGNIFVTAAPVSASNGLTTGGQVFCSATTLVCTISAATFTLNGVSYSSPQTDVTLVADGANPRIDTFYVGCTLAAGVCDGTNNGIANFIPGTPAGSPASPSVDPTIEIETGFATIAANGTHATVTNETIYLEDTGGPGEWNMTETGAGINLAGATGCFASSTKCIIGTAVTAGQSFKGVRPAGTVIPASYSVLNFQLKSAATWPKNKCLNIAFYNSTTLVGNPVSVCNGSFAFNSSQTSTYQQIAIAASLFNATTAVDTVIFSAVGGGAAFGWTVDNIQLQSGITPPPPPTGGTVTNIATGTGLTGGPITTSGTISIASGGVTPTQLSTNANLRTCMIVVGSDNAASVIADADLGPQGQRCTLPYAGTVTEIRVDADSTGTPNVIVRKKAANGTTYTNLLSGALATSGTANNNTACASINAACYDGSAKSGSVTIVTAGSANVLAAGESLGLTSGTAGGVSKRMSISIYFTVN